MIQFQENIPLAKFSNYKIGGPARYFFEANNLVELEEALRKARDLNVNVFILGGGTNLLVSDAGFDGLVLKPNFALLESDGNVVRAGAGVLMEDLLRFTVDRKLSGLEWAGGLPGTVGGAVRGNAGAFGEEIKDNAISVQSFNSKDFASIERDVLDCKFGYRSSIFKEKKGEEIVLIVTLKLRQGDPEKINEAIQAKVTYRHERHPMEYPNIGSIFKNVPVEKVGIDPAALHENRGGTIRVAIQGAEYTIPVKIDPFPVVPTAYLISETNLKGTRHGGAMISEKHPNFIVNVSSATASDVKYLMGIVREEVKKKFGVDLEQEVEFL